jgi:hypothetical protein
VAARQAAARLLGQERIGNPTLEVALSMVEGLASYIRTKTPLKLKKCRLGPSSFSQPRGASELDLKESRIPAMHYTKVKGYLRQQKRAQPMPEADFQAIQAAFDKKATHLLAEAERVSVVEADDEE